MTQENEEKRVEKILEELNKVLDEVIKKKKLVKEYNEEVTDYKQKIDEIKDQLKDVVKKYEVVKQTPPTESVSDLQNYTKAAVPEEKQQKLTEAMIPSEDVSKPKIEPISPSLFNKQNQEQQTLQPNIEQHIEPKIETKQEKEVSQLAEEGVIIKNVIFVYPSIMSESKDIFFENINSTLSRVSKNKVKLSPSLVIEYNSIEKDFLLNPVNMNKIKSIKDALFFLIVNESNFESEEFVSKISDSFSFIKVITFKELKLKSTYLDISIDILLTVK